MKTEVIKQQFKKIVKLVNSKIIKHTENFETKSRIKFTCFFERRIGIRTEVLKKINVNKNSLMQEKENVEHTGFAEEGSIKSDQ